MFNPRRTLPTLAAVIVLAAAGGALAQGTAPAAPSIAETEAPSDRARAEAQAPIDPAELGGVAEDLWGSRIDLTRHRRGLTLIGPFSPANCGYCLVDGTLIARNYLERNGALGGTSFQQCLFNPQLDVYTYMKHFRAAGVPVLTFPLTLHQHHQNGFPFLIAFRDGRPVQRRGLLPYDVVFESLRGEFWPGQAVPFVLASPSHIGSINCLSAPTVWVAADGDGDGYRRRVQAAERVNQKVRQSPGGLGAPGFIEVRYERELAQADLQKNLEFAGASETLTLGALEGQATPLRIGPERIEMGKHSFAKADVGLSAWFPNPRNPERYVSLVIRGANVRRSHYENWVDFVVYGDSAEGTPDSVILRGFFDKTDPAAWRFSDTLVQGTDDLKCDPGDAGGCPAPPPRPPRPVNPHRIAASAPTAGAAGELRTLSGGGTGRFPRLGLGPDGTGWVVWEERGDILLSSLDPEAEPTAVAVEDGPDDSFHPIAASDGALLWVFYLSDRDGVYRLYARSWDGERLSDPVVCSGGLPCDAITPAAVGAGQGRIVVAWSDWMANVRHLRFRRIENRTLGDIETARAFENAQTDGYINAWSASLSFDEQGVWGAWNQHYPALLGVCAGDLEHAPSSVTRLADADGEENGGYPATLGDERGRRWVFWESFGWDVLDGTPQSIRASYYDTTTRRWTIPYTLSDGNATMLAQTPRAALDQEGVLWVVWSGRASTQDIEQPWSVYLSRFVAERWSHPVRISPADVNARAPDILVDGKNRLWVTWHTGVGQAMRIGVLRHHEGGGAP